MAQEKFFVADGYSLISVDHFQAYLRADVIEKPYVVIAYEPCYLDAAVGKARECAEKACVSARNDCAVFIPVVDDVAKQIQAVGGAGY